MDGIGKYIKTVRFVVKTISSKWIEPNFDFYRIRLIIGFQTDLGLFYVKTSKIGTIGYFGSL